MVSVAPPIELTVEIVAEFQLKDQSQYSSRKKLKERHNGFGALAQPHREPVADASRGTILSLHRTVPRDRLATLENNRTLELTPEELDALIR